MGLGYAMTCSVTEAMLYRTVLSFVVLCCVWLGKGLEVLCSARCDGSVHPVWLLALCSELNAGGGRRDAAPTVSLNKHTIQIRVRVSRRQVLASAEQLDQVATMS